MRVVVSGVEVLHDERVTVAVSPEEGVRPMQG